MGEIIQDRRKRTNKDDRREEDDGLKVGEEELFGDGSTL
jgi:hypothetical protein